MWPERNNDSGYEWKASERQTNREYYDSYATEFAEDYDNRPPRGKGVKTNKRRKAQKAKAKKKGTRRG